jgi:MFS transporter, MHS family, proline/betaine transporter
MLYIHMAVLLNELFFPSTDSETQSLLSSFAFCSTYLLRPIGALVFGYIGDHIGRRVTVMITTVMMSLSCLAMANLPTYAQIGITASWLVTICRIVQGMSSMGEIIGAELYLTETIKVPERYSAVAIVVVASSFGGMVALLVAYLVTSYGSNWRLAFLVGTGVALIGFMARLTLRESAEYANAKERLKQVFLDSGQKLATLEKNPIWNEKVKVGTLISYFIMESVSPVYFYLNYIYCGNLLKSNFHYTSEQVISHNLNLGIVNFVNAVLLTLLCSKFHPLKILKAKLYLFIPFIIAFPVLLDIIGSPYQLLILQISCIFLCCTAFPANSVIFVQFPIFKRFTCATFIFAISKAVMYATPAFGLVYLNKYFGNIGILFILIPINIAYILARNYFEMLEIEADKFHMKKSNVPVFE